MKSTLIKGVNQLQYEDYIVHYHINGDVVFPDEFPTALPETISRINARIDAIQNVPDPKEKDHWEAVRVIGENALRQPLHVPVIKDAIHEVKQYIDTWSVKRCKDNHLEDAANLLDRLNNALLDAQRQSERDEWDAVNKFDYDAIIDYLKHHRSTPFLNEADEFLWDIIRTTRPLKRSAVRRYMGDARTFGLSHYDDAQEILDLLETWGGVVENPTWRSVFNFMQDHPDSAFQEEAQELLDELVEKEMEKMRKNPAPYDAQDCRDLVSFELLSKYSLKAENLITDESFSKMMGVEDFKKKHPIPNPKGDYFADSDNENVTDIFLFGIPATGKTSVLMGLLQSGRFQFNPVVADGEYGEILQNYVDNGYMPPQTLENFVAICTGSVIDSKGINHAVNIIDMAGEDFAVQIARNPEGKVSFADMGHSAAKLLDSRHRKLFFVVIDPTGDKVTLQRPVYQYDDEGNVVNILEFKDIPIYQNQTLNRLVNLFSDPQNAAVMKKVDGIHFLMTKADTLDPEGEGQEIKEAAARKKIMSNKYRSQVEHVKRLCDESELDLPAPRLFLFSLGNFFVGNVFEFDPTDADTILDMVAGNSVGVAKNNMWDKMVSFFSKPFF